MIFQNDRIASFELLIGTLKVTVGDKSCSFEGILVGFGIIGGFNKIFLTKGDYKKSI